MFAIFSMIGGIFSGIGGAVKGYFYKKTAEEVIESVDRNIDRVIPIARDTITTVGKAAEAASTVTTNVATVAKSDNDVAIEMHRQVAEGAGSWLTNNVRPIGFLVSFGILIAQMFGYAPPSEWPLTICLAYMGARTVDKLGQILGIGSVMKNLKKDK